jgi:hypothetical protein
MFEPHEGSSSTPERPDRFDLVVFGDDFVDWLPVLADGAPIWQRIPSVRAGIRHRGRGWTGEAEGEVHRRLVLPLIEYNIWNCPPQCWALVPTREAVDILRDKQRFAEYATANGLGWYVPLTYRPTDDPAFPAILKRTNLYAGHGVKLVHSAEDIVVSLREKPWAGHPVIVQEYVDASFEYATHCIAVGGTIRWHRTYEFDIPPAAPIRVPRQHEVPRRAEIDASDLAIFERFLRPLQFSGPCNFNYSRRRSGEVAVFEINPRFGGSLFRPSQSVDLAEALNSIISNVTWRP